MKAVTYEQNEPNQGLDGMAESINFHLHPVLVCKSTPPDKLSVTARACNTHTSMMLDNRDCFSYIAHNIRSLHFLAFCLNASLLREIALHVAGMPNISLKEKIQVLKSEKLTEERKVVL
ncbi:hypothetical protein OSTOST_14436 [Ostertagia ostertagi]